MSLAEQIDAIIRQRNSLVPKLEKTEVKLKKAAEAIEKLEILRDSPDMDDELSSILSSVSTVDFRKKYQESLEALERLKARFGRDEINISFVGRAGQGKSLILQKISGLDGNVIPSADGSDCTGARSVISNDSLSGKTTAEITFFSEAELVNIVNTYLHAILGSNNMQAGSLSGISNIDIKEIRKNLAPEQEMQKNLLTHLEKYVVNAEKLAPLLGKKITVGKDDIEQYVAQYKRDDKSLKYFNYLGVKEAIIKSPFPYADAGKITLVDTIGTGATSLGVDRDMLETVRNASDAIVVMKRPEPLRPRMVKEDYELLKMLREELGSDYTSRLLFWLFNRVETGKGANSESIPELMTQMQKENLPVAALLNIDCSREEEVREKLLVPLLQQMSSTLGETDALLIERLNADLKAVASAFNKIGSALDKAFGASLNPDERRHFSARIQSTIAKMTNSLRNLYIELDTHKNTPREELQDIAAEKLKRTLLSAPTNEKIMEKLNNGTITQHTALEHFTDEMRLKIINEFLELDSTLQEIVANAKRNIIEILASEQNGNFNAVAGSDIKNPDIWLDRLFEKIDENQYPLINYAIKNLREFDLSVENFLIYKVRACLEQIDWSIRKQPPQLYNGLDDKQALTEEINFILHDLLEGVHSKLNKELKNYFSFPNEAIFAVTRDFHDRITKAVNPATGLNAEDEWRYIYEDFIPVIWRDEHMEFGKKGSAMQRWREVSDVLEECGRDNYFLID